MASSVFIDSLGLTMLTLRESEFVQNIQWATPEIHTSCYRCGGSVEGESWSADALGVRLWACSDTCMNDIERFSAWVSSCEENVQNRWTDVERIGPTTINDACMSRFIDMYRRTVPVEKPSKPTRREVVSSGDAINRRLVFRRDHYICHICGHPTDLHEVHPHPLAPVIDHVAPIAAGGVHIAENLRCAHSFCNGIKGARPLTESMRDDCRKRIRAHITLH